MPGRSYRNNFTSGVLDEKLGARSDLEQWRTGLRVGTNVLLLPHGGVRRRPGIRYLFTASEDGRLGRFRFSKDQQYLLRFENGIIKIYDAVTKAYQTTLVSTPYDYTKLSDLYLKAQIADTMVIFHPEVAPHRFFRQSCGTDAIQTCGDANKLRVRLAQHDLATGDTVAISGATGFGGYEAGAINTSVTLTVPSGTVTSGSDLVWKQANRVEINVDSAGGVDNKGFKIGDSIELSGFGALPGIPSDQINRSQTITDIRGRITVTAGAAATSAISGGGNAVTVGYTQSGRQTRTVSGSNLVYVGLPTGFTGLRIGDTIAITSATTTGGIAGSAINGTRTIVSINEAGDIARIQADQSATSSATGTASVAFTVALNNAPITTTATSSVLSIDVPSWFAAGVVVGQSLSISGAIDVGGIVASTNINGSRVVGTTTAGGSRLQFATQSPGTTGTQSQLGSWKADGFFEVAFPAGVSNPLGFTSSTSVETTNGSSLIVVNISKGAFTKGFVAGDYIWLDGLTAVGGIAANYLNGTHRVVSSTTQGAKLTIDVGVTATSTTTSTTVGTWESVSQLGGGSSIRVWSLSSMAPSTDRKTKLFNVPQFDFSDGLSPQPKAERQELVFDGFTAGDQYSLTINMPGIERIGRLSDAGTSVSIRTSKLKWDSTPSKNATIMQDAINKASNEGDVVTVTYDTTTTNPYKYILQFLYARPIDLVQIENVTSANGTVSATQLVEGGSTAEDVVSATRGWPAGGIFYQRRLWMFGLPSRPATFLASQTEDFFNFDVGDGLDSEAIDATGEFDRIKHMVSERGLFLLTEGSEVAVTGGGDGAAITPGNVNLQVASRYGATSVQPVSVAGRPMYVDSIGRNIRQFGPSQDQSGGGSTESKEVSILSQSLINNPVRMDLWRNADGDYLFVVNSDGTCAVLNINLDQGVVGWTKVTTSSNGTAQATIKDVCEAGSSLFVTVYRSGAWYVGVFDYGYYTDFSSIQSTSGASTAAVQLAGLTVQVRCDGKTLDSVAAGAGLGSISLLSSGSEYYPTVETAETGLAIPVPTVVPMAPQVDMYSGISKASVDLYESKQVYVNGYKLRDSLISPTIASETAITGFRPIQLRGYSDRISITITAPNPQPMHIRAIEMEIV